MPRVTLRAINAAIESQRPGRAERLVRGNGYFYFVAGNSMSWYTSSVMTYRLDGTSVDYWIRALDGFIRENEQ